MTACLNAGIKFGGLVRENGPSQVILGCYHTKHHLLKGAELSVFSVNPIVLFLYTDTLS